MFLHLWNVCYSYIYFWTQIIFKFICHLYWFTVAFTIWKVLNYLLGILLFTKITNNLFRRRLIIFFQLVNVLKYLLISNKEGVRRHLTGTLPSSMYFRDKSIFSSVYFVPFVWFYRHDWALLTHVVNDFLPKFISVLGDEVTRVHAYHRGWFVIVTYLWWFWVEKVLA